MNVYYCERLPIRIFDIGFGGSLDVTDNGVNVWRRDRWMSNAFSAEAVFWRSPVSASSSPHCIALTIGMGGGTVGVFNLWKSDGRGSWTPILRRRL